MIAPFSGGCACGPIRYTYSVAPIAMLNCHCQDCQISSGTPFASDLIVAAASTQVTGAPSTRAVTATSGSMTVRSFCGTCGTPLFMHGEVVPDFMSIRLPTLDKLSDFKPMLDIWAARAQAWNGKPIVFAAVYAVISAIASWAFGESFLMALFGGILAFVYCAGFFWLVDRYRDDVSKPLGILLSGAAVLLILAFT